MTINPTTSRAINAITKTRVVHGLVRVVRRTSSSKLTSDEWCNNFKMGKKSKGGKKEKKVVEEKPPAVVPAEDVGM